MSRNRHKHPPSPADGRRGLLIASKRRRRYALPRFLARLFAVDLRALGLFRIGLALLLLADYIGRFMDVDAFYTDAGLVPREVAERWNGGDWWSYVSPYMWFGDRTPTLVLFSIAFFAGVCLLVGWRTRLATIVSWGLLAALHTRNPVVLHGADQETRLLLFWSMFLPLGARFSLDGLAAHRVAGGLPRPKRVVSFGTAGMLLQIACLYWFAVLLKNGVEWRHDFTALYYALSIESYTTPFAHYLRDLRWAMKPLTVLTLCLEGGGPVLALLPLRTWKLRAAIACVFIFFHLVLLNLAFDLGPFPYVAALAWVLFLPSPVWNRVARLWHKLPGVPPKHATERAREAVVAWRNHSVARATAKRAARGLRPPAITPHPVAQTVAALALAFVVLYNTRTIEDFPPLRQIPRLPDVLVWTTRLDQRWGMFAPKPMIDDGWFVAVAHTRDGTEFDLLTHRAPVSWEKPPFIARMYPSERWRKYQMNLWGLMNDWQRPYFLRYLARQWNQTHKGPGEVSHIDLYYVRRNTLPDYQASKLEPLVICNYDVDTDPKYNKQ